MRLAFVRVKEGTAGTGRPGPAEIAFWFDDAVLLVGRAWPDNAPVPATMMAVIAAEATGVATVREAGERALERPELLVPHAMVDVLAPVPSPPRIFALARNYAAHAAEQGGAANRDGSLPQVFLKPTAGTLNRHGGAIPIDERNVFLDYEVELGVVIGRGGRNIPAERALDHVFGYTVLNDISERQLHARVEGRNAMERDAFFDWLNGKWMAGSCPIGPCVTTADVIADPHALAISCRVNGETRQDATTAQMIHRVPDIIAFLSGYLTLLPGDIIATGTPSGVGKARGIKLERGDEIESTIEGIGTLQNRVDVVPQTLW